MVKFSKELEAQLIPEWKDAFVNYWKLKKHVKKVKILFSMKASAKTCEVTGLNRACNLWRLASSYIAGGPRHEIIEVREREGDEGEGEGLFKTDLVRLFTEDDEVKVFFEMLDEELNKVNKFYKVKEGEFLERGEILNNQLQILLDLKRILHHRCLPRSNSSSVRSSDCSESMTETDESVRSPEYETFAGFTRLKTKKESLKIKGKPKTAMRIEIPATTPTKAILAITQNVWEDIINHPKKEPAFESLNRKKIQCAQKMIRGAFVELYKGLGLLKTYSSLNMVAFTKILKKFDKVSKQEASSTYLKAVKRSYFISSDKVVRLMDEVESIFTKHFANNERKKAMKFLRPQPNRDSHIITFLVGLFTGCFVTLFTVYAFLAHLSGMYSTTTTTEAGYMETVYPVFSMFALLSLHMFLYGCNLFTWQSARINNNFIFDFSPGNSLRYRDVFLICTSFMTLVVAGMVTHLVLRAKGYPPSTVDTLPGILLLVFTGLLICPFNVFYRPSRYYFLRVIRNIICSPFYKVLMVDFFMADQLTSQVPLLRHMEFTACYYLAGSFKTHQYQTCKNNKLYKELAYVISFLPYYWRAMQCARRWFDEGDINHVANLGKYVSAMLAAGARLTYAMQPTPTWFALVIITSTMATIYQLYWDFVKDWGLLNPKSKNPWLRDELILKHNSIYYASIIFNFILRLVWVETVMHLNIGRVDSRVLDFFMASLEIIRRGHWNFYRLENEHLNNVGKFRAVKTVPLPFQEHYYDN
ncbi:phosphate transporter PHO1 [Amborella trichopoda]|uniref:PHO1 n=1 Tax=Amborella trichopoda TaxID=13333 RepID=U5D8M0_AMBTC|nr:phosphate transporter PHO1 [Amborella trichopoda]ERN18829.1 hypothetical protein AMTR_s00067p00117540 [Amborella trichopoda]|eukprot:XP_020530960.1 phosphate transporter PHO1 [Amborella trichopoda]